MKRSSRWLGFCDWDCDCDEGRPRACDADEDDEEDEEDEEDEAAAIFKLLARFARETVGESSSSSSSSLSVALSSESSSDSSEGAWRLGAAAERERDMVGSVLLDLGGNGDQVTFGTPRQQTR